MVQQTSLEAWYAFKDERFSRQEQEIMECLQSNPRISYSTISRLTGLTINAVCGRMDSLKKKGAVWHSGFEINPKTGVKNRTYCAYINKYKEENENGIPMVGNQAEYMEANSSE